MYVRSIIAVAGLALAVSGGNADAAPQVLGVMSSADPIPMTCANGQCSAELSAFCLEQGRSGPKDGTAYRAVDPTRVSLVAIHDDGSAEHAAGSSSMRFASARGYSAVRVSVPESTLVELGAKELAVAVAPELTLAPVEIAGDPQPLTHEEIAEAAHTARALAAEIFDDSDRAQVVTAAVLNRLINSLPPAGDARTIDIASRDGLWGRVVGGVPRIDDADAGKAQAALVFESCRRGATYVQGLTLRRCLEASHDALMSTMNGELWQVLGAGS
ncbi:MAG TPA: hypothetical protein VEJ16_07425 [Alphaproteobacteria bacterium]|nr:hypothetical protein [Alphaproteobacteria bacterium]